MSTLYRRCTYEQRAAFLKEKIREPKCTNEMFAKIIEAYVMNPNISYTQLAKSLKVKHYTVSRALDRYFSIPAGENTEILILESKV
jgi:DNA-binding MarR family transcriptional regulator